MTEPDMANLPDDAFEPRELDDDFMIREFEMMERPRKWPRLLRRANGVNTVELVNLDTFPRHPPHRKLLLMLLLLALKDRASEVHFEPWRPEGEPGAEVGLRMFYVVDGELLELVPPPACLAGPTFRDLDRVSGIDSLRHRIANSLRRVAGWFDGQPPSPRRGRFRLVHDNGHADVKLWVHHSELGGRYFLTLTTTPAFTPDEATDDMRRLFDRIFERCRPVRPSATPPEVEGSSIRSPA